MKNGTAVRSTIVLTLSTMLVVACGGGANVRKATELGEIESGDQYVIGAGDSLQVFVWGHDDLSTGVAVRPDGNISTPLVEDMAAAGKTPTELARAVEERLSEFIRSPTVTIIVQEFVGEFDRKIRVVGQATEPKSLNYRAGMTLLDVVIAVGGLGEFAAGNRARVVRKQNGEELVIKVKLNNLLNDGDMSQNIEMRPGDVLIIPESAF